MLDYIIHCRLCFLGNYLEVVFLVVDARAGVFWVVDVRVVVLLAFFGFAASCPLSTALFLEEVERRLTFVSVVEVGNFLRVVR
jgi:hypothetical protein